VLAVLDEPNLAELWGPNSRAEVPIVGLIGEQALSGQIDRLVVTDGRVLIVDFKTVRPAPASEQQVPALYLQQLATYRAALRRIYPGHEVDGAFLWTDGPVLMPIAAALLDRHLPGRLAPRRLAG
jgi:ATP-dependent helicase/nuclease subunit A